MKRLSFKTQFKIEFLLPLTDMFIKKKHAVSFQNLLKIDYCI